MSQRQALVELSAALLPRASNRREQWFEQLGRLRFPVVRDLQGPGTCALHPDVIERLDTLAGQPPDGEPPVALVEKLHLLIRLSNALREGAGSGLIQLDDGGRGAVEEVAKGLLAPDGLSRAPDVLASIDALAPGVDVVVFRGLDSDLRLTRRTGPITPTEPFELPAIGELFGELTLQPALAAHPVVLVEAYIYQALVNGQAEYPVHLRTTLHFHTNMHPFNDFLPILEPHDWPNYNSFWQHMDPVPTHAAGGAAGQASAAAQGYDAKVGGQPPWHVVGPFHEQVGFPNDQDLYPDTYLYFLVQIDAGARALLTYTLLDRLRDLAVDDGCIEITKVNGGVDVVTTKSLYVSGAGNDVELAGILAYVAESSGWGAQTLALVANAVG